MLQRRCGNSIDLALAVAFRLLMEELNFAFERVKMDVLCSGSVLAFVALNCCSAQTEEEQEDEEKEKKESSFAVGAQEPCKVLVPAETSPFAFLR
jgi:small neutral amino acid transporter SnatA (MarC family)